MTSSKKILTLACIALVGLAFTGCSSDSSTPAAPAIDTAPPAVPVDLAVQIEGASAVVTWGVNTTDSDLAGYIVVRDHRGTTDLLVASPAMIQSYVDPTPPAGPSTYQVYAVDQSGNESAVASVNLLISLTHTPENLTN